MKHLLKKIALVPHKPGCYLFFNDEEEIIYAGKSKDLRKRLSSHVSSSDQTEFFKYQVMYAETADFAYITTPNETEALILECELIKKFRPRYNAQLVRDRTFHHLKITTSEPLPRFFPTTQKDPLDTSNVYFGFFYNEREVLSVIECLSDIFETPACGKETFPKNHRACLNYHLKRCSAPCKGYIDSEQYKPRVEDAIKCLKGLSIDSIIMSTKVLMEEASECLDFDSAILYRNRLSTLITLSRKINRLNTDLTDSRVILLFRAFHEDAFCAFFIDNEYVTAKGRFELLSETLNEDLINFGSQILNAKKALYPKSYTMNLTEIYADKYYIHLTKADLSAAVLASKMKEAFEAFITPQASLIRG
jgi:excinuclease ABC subunit C